MPKNVTPNCSMFDLIIVYFKGIHMFVDSIEESINTGNDETSVITDSEINELITGKLGDASDRNLVKKLFNLKDIRECESEAIL